MKQLKRARVWGAGEMISPGRDEGRDPQHEPVPTVRMHRLTCMYMYTSHHEMRTTKKKKKKMSKIQPRINKIPIVFKMTMAASLRSEYSRSSDLPNAQFCNARVPFATVNTVVDPECSIEMVGLGGVIGPSGVNGRSGSSASGSTYDQQSFEAS